MASVAWAPSPHHSAPWRCAVLMRREARARLADAMGNAWATDLRGDGVSEARIAAILAGSRERIVEAPAAVVLCTSDERLDRYPDARRQAAEQAMAAQSVGAALQNLMLSAYARGLASCWMCAPLFCPDAVVASLGLDPALHPQALVTLGYPEAWPPPHPPTAANDLVALWD